VTSSFLQGEQPYARVEIIDHNQRLADPQTLTLRTLVNGTERPEHTLDGMTRISKGRYEQAIQLDTAGTWWLQWRSTNPTTVTEQTFTVTASRFD
jgi:hypothetical protein